MTLQEARKAKGLSQADFADGIGVSLRALVSYEAGARRPQPEAAQRIAEYCSLSIEQIWEMFYSPKESDHAVPSA